MPYATREHSCIQISRTLYRIQLCRTVTWMEGVNSTRFFFPSFYDQNFSGGRQRRNAATGVRDSSMRESGQFWKWARGKGHLCFTPSFPQLEVSFRTWWRSASLKSFSSALRLGFRLIMYVTGWPCVNLDSRVAETGTLVLLLDLPSPNNPCSTICPSRTQNKGNCICCIISPVTSNNAAEKKKEEIVSVQGVRVITSHYLVHGLCVVNRADAMRIRY